MSGTPPEQMLDRLEVDRVSGDDVAGFFRTRSDDDDDPVVEAYSWGGLTSRSWTRALWVVLAPFALVNVAGWMIPPGRPVWSAHDSASEATRVGMAHRVATGTVRLAGLLVTALITVWVGQVAMDMVAYQCGGIGACREGNVVVGTVFGSDSMASAPARRIVVGAVIPAALLGLMWLLGKISRSRYDDFSRLIDLEAVEGGFGSFGDPGFWGNERVVGVLTRAHVTSGVLIVCSLLATSMGLLAADSSTWPGSLWQILSGVALVALVAVAAVVATLEVGGDGVSIDVRARTGGVTARWRFGKAVFWGSWALLATIGVLAWTAAIPPAFADVDGGSQLGSFAVAGPGLPFLLVVLAGVLTAALWRHPGRLALTGRDRPVDVPAAGFGGFGAVAAMLLGYGMAAVLLLALSSWMGRLLGGRPLLDYPAGYDAAAVLVFWFAIPVLALAAWAAAKTAGRRFDQTIQQTEDLPAAGFDPDLHDLLPVEDRPDAAGPVRDAWDRARASWVAKVRRARVLRVLVAEVDTVAWVVLGLVFPVLGVIAIPPFFGIDTGAWLTRHTPAWMITTAVWAVAVGLPLAVFAVVRESFANKARRRQIGIMWDVLTFWPRWFHPLAPPNYSARAVPELQTRLDALASAGTDIVVSAHSQGTLLALAALDGIRDTPTYPDRHHRGFDATTSADLDDGPMAASSSRRLILDHVALLTHGSPITRLYARYFPAYTCDSIRRVQAALTANGGMRWCNLYRATDPIGGAILPERNATDPRADSTRPPDKIPGRPAGMPLPDPDISGAARPFPPLGTRYPDPHGHSNYNRSSHYETSLASLLSKLKEQRPSSPSHIP